MGFLNKLFGVSSRVEKHIPWNRLITLEQFDALIEESKEKHIAVFKHSSRCGISRMVLKDFQRNYSIPEEQVKLYYLDILSYNDISDELSEKFQVLHESPQLLVIKNARLVHESSHFSIDVAVLNDLVAIGH